MNLLLGFFLQINSQKSNKIIQYCQICALAVAMVGGLSQAALADLSITSTTNTTAIENALTGQDINVSNVTINQGSFGNQVGVFEGGDTGGAGPLLSIADGVVLVTGVVTTADGPNRSSSRTTGGELGPSDSSLASVDDGIQYDTVALQFDVEPAGNTLSMEFVFASEEYNEFVCTTFNDAMGIFVSGPGLTGEVNIARLDRNLANFSINQINRGVAGAASSVFPAACSLDNSEFYVNNIAIYNEQIVNPNIATPTGVQNNYTNVEYDGFTIPLAAQLQVQPGEVYTVKVVTADIGDSLWDGGVFVDTINSFNLDYGDAPDSYGTTGVNGAIQLPGPARHSTGSGVYLGITPPDAESNGTPATSPNPADGDDSTGDDEDAFNELTVTSGITSHTISDIPVSNTSSQTAQLMGWIDFNQDGDFLDAGEQAVVNVDPNQTSANLTWSDFAETTTGNTYARFRITTDPNLTGSPSPVGLALDGEVEDYQVAILDPPNIGLIKRITAINPDQSNEVQFNTFVDDGTADNEDNDPNWPDGDDTYLPGTITVDNIQPGDEVEYTIYFLSNGEQAATNVQICDVIPDNMSFVGNSFDNDFGIALLNSSASGATATNLSNAADSDGGTFYAPGAALPTVGNSSTNLCQKIDSTGTTVPVDASNNINGAVVVEIDTIPKADNPGDPANSYGFIRFRAKVQ